MEKKLNGAGGEAVKVTCRADDETDDGVTGVGSDDDDDGGDDES